MCDCTIVTDRHVRHNRPDITVVFPIDQKFFLIDIAIPGEGLSSKVLEKHTCYTDLKIEVEKFWTVKCFIVPIVTGALGSISFNLTKCFEYHRFTSFVSENNAKDCFIVCRSLD